MPDKKEELAMSDNGSAAARPVLCESCPFVEQAKQSSNSVQLKMGSTSIKLPMAVLIVILGGFGVGGAAATGGYFGDAASGPVSEETNRLLAEQIHETRRMRKAVEATNGSLRRLKIEVTHNGDEIDRIKRRDLARDTLHGIEDDLEDFPLDRPLHDSD